jgi:4-carboxymuconolactone decarboxylase
MAESEMFERGLQARRDVLGAEYVDANLADTDEFMMAFQQVVTEWAWGYAWSRPGLDRKTRSMLNLAILTALGRPDELGIYVKGAIATGVSVDEIKEILIHATVYCARHTSGAPGVSGCAFGSPGRGCAASSELSTWN